MASDTTSIIDDQIDATGAQLETTTDAFFDEQVRLQQPRTGYRFNLDSILLARECATHHPSLVLDVGAGCGVLGAVIQRWCPNVKVISVEREPELVACLRRNALRIPALEPVEGDVRSLDFEPIHDAVVMNPPYFPAGSGRLPPDACRAAARHQLHGDLRELVAAGVRGLATAGRLHLVYPADQLPQVRAVFESVGLTSVQVRAVHPAPDREPRHMLFTAMRGGASLQVAMGTPLVVRDAAGCYTPEVQDTLGGPLAPSLPLRPLAPGKEPT